MELRQLRYFVATACNGSMSKASKSVYVAQSALSKQISMLEEELGTPLFLRTTGGVRMSSAGEIFLVRAQLILKEVEDLRTAFRRLDCRPERSSSAAVD